MKKLIRDVTYITHADVDELLNGNMLALRVSGFIPASSAVEIADRLVGHWSLSRYRNTPELVRVGESHYETHDDDGSVNPAALDAYLARADTLMDGIREACAPHQSPMDILWQQLDEEFGIERARIEGREMFAGICRVFPEGTELLPHNDRLSRDAPGLRLGAELVGQLAANIYLRVPRQGGELELWDLRPSEDQLAAWHAQGSEYGVDRALIRTSDLALRPAPGDLLIIDATRLHAVARQVHGSRVNLSCFFGIRPGHPLVCWS